LLEAFGKPSDVFSNPYFSDTRIGFHKIKLFCYYFLIDSNINTEGLSGDQRTGSLIFDRSLTIRVPFAKALFSISFFLKEENLSSVLTSVLNVIVPFQHWYRRKEVI